ncbi:Protein of unknown function DUF2043 [Macleaya cordata]|uniref:UV-stimulated scaffold protein A C-terminal domain-containing protein n=1 Tax=Macleaya cordata TaxID=56857 RepID=A0A200PRY2_MACCD|nr:Protein of unknown function DUF2043 [Macleaya cordata]
MEEERDEGGGEVISLIDRATNSTAAEVNPRLLKSIKSVVRSSDSEIELAVETLMEKMKKNHSQVRYLALLIINELFMRSKLFRSLLVVNFDHFLSLSIGFRRNLPLPAPPAIAVRLRSKAIEYLEKWNTSFGIHYRQIRLGFDYLKNTLHFQFPNLQQNAARLQQERREREIRSKEILLKKFETLRENLPSIKDEINSTLEEIGECLDILHTNEDDFIPTGLADDEEVEEFRCSDLQQIRIESLKESERVHESSDNKVICDALRELYKLLVTKHLFSVQEWISVLLRVEPSDTRFRDSTLKEFIDLQNHLKAVRKRCEQSGCALTNTTNYEEEDFWEEGKIQVFGAKSSNAPARPNEDLASTSTVNEEKNIDPRQNEASNVSERLDGEGDDSDSNSVRRKLLSEAPVMNWGSSLDNWSSNRDVLANQRGLELAGHWGRVDYDAVIPAAKIAELNVQATVYKEEHVDIQPCLAPLRKGGLCQRRDLKVCPFHGPIIPRDAEGNPINQVPSTDKGTTKLETEVVRQLAEQAVKNVRERDRWETKKRINDRKSLNRAKLAKVREHNEAVLREAAIASTSHSAFVGEDWEGEKNRQSRAKRAKVCEHDEAVLRQSTSRSQFAGEDRDRENQRVSFVKEKKQTLASMLRKKVTTKDRLAQRLLNTRATDATVRQLTIGEDAKYREAYPNQW